MVLSVIIPTRNRARYLEGALSSLKGQTFGTEHFEVLVVDNGSTDNTREVCETCRAFLPNLQYVYESHPGLHVGRHVGMERAQADILVYADDDIEAFPTWLEGISEAFSDEQVVLAGGKNLPRFQVEPPVWIRRMWEKDHMDGRMLPYLSILDLGDELKVISPYYVFGCNFSIRKAVLIEAGGFHPDAMPPGLIRYRGDGETYISQYILERGYMAIYHPKASVYHLVPKARLSESYFQKRAFSQGISDSYTDLRNNSISFLRNRRFFGFMIRLLKMLRFTRQARIQVGYFEGYCYHQEEVRKDPELHNWVVRETYID